MSGFKADDLLALHFYRNDDGSAYAVGNFRDKTVGKNGVRVIADNISLDAVLEAAGIKPSAHGSDSD